MILTASPYETFMKGFLGKEKMLNIKYFNLSYIYMKFDTFDSSVKAIILRSNDNDTYKIIKYIFK